MIKDRLSPHQRGCPTITVLKGLDIKGRLSGPKRLGQGRADWIQVTKDKVPWRTFMNL
jgi:hypothetical protein